MISRCKGGSLFWPERSLVDHIHGAAITFGCQKRYDPSVANEAQRWIPSIELLGLKGKLREVFHRQDGEILYAGTFQASTAMSEYGVEEYRALPEDLRKHLLNLSFAPVPPGHPKVSEEEKASVAAKYWSGEATLAYLRWDRVGFNAELFKALVSLREAYASLSSESGTHEVSASGGKRKDEGHGPSSRKKFRFDQSVAISHLL
ncbi:hypothetical protein BC629DRAFT_1543617 [Irpex lacteus]|nr:hypothetical protein BC629DRAFT_1543617 [Irpex lacteus]